MKRMVAKEACTCLLMPPADTWPAHGDDEAHGREGGLHVPVDATRGYLAGLAREDFEKDEAPAAHAETETRSRVNELRLACVARCQHEHGAEEQAEEHALADVGLHRLEDQVELDHLQGNGDRPVDVAVQDWGAVDLDPELAHVEIVDGCNQGDKGTAVQRSLPVGSHVRGLHQEEQRGGDHRDRDDPEGDGDGVIWVKESVLRDHGVQILSHGEGTEDQGSRTPTDRSPKL